MFFMHHLISTTVSTLPSSPGHLLATCDSHQIFLWEYVKFSYPLASSASVQPPAVVSASELPPDEIWKIKHKIVESRSDIFDLCWCGTDKLIRGGLNGIVIWDIQTRCKGWHVGMLHLFTTTDRGKVADEHV